MRGLTDPERSLLLLLMEANGGPISRSVTPDEANASPGLRARGVLKLGPMCRCGRHPTVRVTPLGREVEALDRAAREPWLVPA
jgi:hypothetical protein